MSNMYVLLCEFFVGPREMKICSSIWKGPPDQEIDLMAMKGCMIVGGWSLEDVYRIRMWVVGWMMVMLGVHRRLEMEARVVMAHQEGRSVIE